MLTLADWKIQCFNYKQLSKQCASMTKWRSIQKLSACGCILRCWVLRDWQNLIIRLSSNRSEDLPRGLHSPFWISCNFVPWKSRDFPSPGPQWCLPGPLPCFAPQTPLRPSILMSEIDLLRSRQRSTVLSVLWQSPQPVLGGWFCANRAPCFVLVNCTCLSKSVYHPQRWNASIKVPFIFHVVYYFYIQYILYKSSNNGEGNATLLRFAEDVVLVLETWKKIQWKKMY